MTIVPPPNFTVLDIAGAARAAVAFSAILLFPGYLAGMATNLFSFRTRSSLERLAWAVALSFCIVPVFVALAGRVVSLHTLALTLGFGAMGALAYLATGWRRMNIPRDRAMHLLAAFVVLGATFVIAELVDIQHGSALHLSVTVLDQAYRVAFTDALALTGIPPSNPLYHPGAAAPLRYYYFWYALCAVCMKLAHVTARQTLIASSIWGGVGLLALLALFARHFVDIRQNLLRFILTAALLLTVTGADLLPTLFNILGNHAFGGDLEWWSKDQISSWLDTVLWVPNHLAAMVACVAALLLLWRSQERTARKDRVAATLLAGMAAAGAFGMSVYVAVGFALLMLAFAVRLGHQRNWPLIRRMGVAAVCACLLSLPYVRELTTGRSAMEKGSAATPAHLLQVSFRRMIDPALITELPALLAAHRAHPVLLDETARLVLLLPGYAIELGFFGMVLVLGLGQRKDLDPPRRTLLFLSVAGLVLVSCVRSGVIENNDFGYRAALLPCFFLLLLATDQMRGPTTRANLQAPGPSKTVQLKTIGLTSLIVLGVAGTVFQAASLRFFLPLEAARRTPGLTELPGDAFAAHRAYTAAGLPAGAIVQGNPNPPSRYAYLVNLLYAQRAYATDAAPECGAVFGGDPAPCGRLRAELTALFGSRDLPAASAVDTCRKYGIGYLAAASADPAWSNPAGWVWSLPLVAEYEQPSPASSLGFRILNCGVSAAEVR